MHQLLDRIDRKILMELQLDGRLSNVELARRVGLSATPCLERVKKLEREGYILGYKAVVDPAKLGQGLSVYVEVTITKTSPDVFEEFNAAVKKHDEIIECHLVSGNFDFYRGQSRLAPSTQSRAPCRGSHDHGHATPRDPRMVRQTSTADHRWRHHAGHFADRCG